jgi:antitoxin PrlF
VIVTMSAEREVPMSTALFLNLLAADIDAHPERLVPLDPALIQYALALTAGVEIDLDAPLSDEDE